MKTYTRIGFATLAIALASNVALAEPGKSKGKGPKTSLDVTNICELVLDDQVNPELGTRLNHKLVVTTTIVDTSDDNGSPTPASSKIVDGAQLVKSSTPPKKNGWEPVGAQEVPIDPSVETVEIHLCNTNPLLDDAQALNAFVQVTAGERNFAGRCDNPYTDENGDGVDDRDESRIDINGLSCVAE